MKEEIDFFWWLWLLREQRRELRALYRGVERFMLESELSDIKTIEKELRVADEAVDIILSRRAHEQKTA